MNNCKFLRGGHGSRRRRGIKEGKGGIGRREGR
jgi:hypothetical protein